MSWARIDDSFHDHPKVDGLSLAAVGLWTLCLTHAYRHRRAAEIRGHVALARVRKVAGHQGARLAAELVDAGLWEACEGGWLIHDFGDYLPKERDPEERRQAGRKGAASRWQSDGKDDGNLPSESMASDSSRASARAFPTRPVTDSSTNTGSPTVAAGTIPNIIRLYVESARDAGVAAPEEAQAKVDRSARSLLSQGYDAHAVEDAARNAAVNGWTDLAIQLQRDTARASPPTGTNGSTSDKRHRDALALADQLEQKAIG